MNNKLVQGSHSEHGVPVVSLILLRANLFFLGRTEKKAFN